MRTQPPGFRWLVGGFALVATVAFGVRFFSSGDRGDLILAVLCLTAAGYWLIFDREPVAEDAAGQSKGGLSGAGREGSAAADYSFGDEGSAGGLRHGGQVLPDRGRDTGR